jgi:hypothetical protein
VVVPPIETCGGLNVDLSVEQASIMTVEMKLREE